MEILLQQEREKLAVMIKEISEGQTDSRLNGYKVSQRSSHYILNCKWYYYYQKGAHEI